MTRNNLEITGETMGEATGKRLEETTGKIITDTTAILEVKINFAHYAWLRNFELSYLNPEYILGLLENNCSIPVVLNLNKNILKEMS